jgi:hypothetical protein
MMGTGEGEGDHRAIAAAEAAISNPLLDDVSLKGARAVLINITGGDDLTLFDVDEATNRIRNDVDPEANIIFGAVFNEDMTGKVRVSVVATGIDGARPAQIQQSFMDVSSSIPQHELTRLSANAHSQTHSASMYGQNTKISQPMFPGSTENWNTQISQPPQSRHHENIAKPVVEHTNNFDTDHRNSVHGNNGAMAKKQPEPQQFARDNIHQPKETINSDTKEYIVSKNVPQQKESHETVDDIVSQISSQNPKGNFSHHVEKEEENSLKGFFGLMGGTKKTSEKRDDENRHIEIQDPKLQNSAGSNTQQPKSKDDDSFEIPAFLRRSLY